MTTLQQLLGIDLPIIQAPMAGVQGSALAVAVCNAGGLGSLPCAMLGLEAMRAELTAIRAQTTVALSQLTYALISIFILSSVKPAERDRITMRPHPAAVNVGSRLAGVYCAGMTKSG